MLEKLFDTAIIDTNDEGLRQLTHERLKVFAKFTDDDCAICLALSPGFARFADEATYEGIVFVRLAADENPVAKLLMKERAAPFFVSYCQGRLLECDTRTTEADVQAQLDRLRDLMPHTA